MKILVILLLSVAGSEEIELAKSPSISCGEAGNKWLETNTVYKDQIDGDMSRQGSYTKDGKLAWGYYCK